MNIESLKKIICNSIPNNIEVSNIKIKNNNNQLFFQIDYIDKSVAVVNPWGRAYACNNDGYIRTIDFNQEFPLSSIKIKKENSLYNDIKDIQELAEKIVSERKDENKEPSVNSKKVFDKIIVTKNDEYIKALVRSGLSKEVATEIASRSPRSWVDTTVEENKKVDLNQPKTTHEGKVITNFDLPLQQKEPTVPYPNTKESVTEKNKPFSFKRAESDVTEYKNSIKNIDGYDRTVKSTKELVEEYKKAAEVYEKRYGRKVKENPHKRKAGMFDFNSKSFSDEKRQVTDVEVLFLANEKMAKLTEPEKPKTKSILSLLKEINDKIPNSTKTQKILHHLKSIKDEILRKTNGKKA